MNKFIKSILLIIIVTGLSVNAFSFASHRFHTSLTRMDYNMKEKSFEVTIQLFTHDFEPVFRQLTQKKSINFEDDLFLDTEILNYLKKHFIITADDEQSLELVWVGKEVKVDTIVIYVEIPFQGKFDNLKMKNTIFFDDFREQVNYVVAGFGDEKSDLAFKVGDSYKQFDNKKK